MNPSRHPNQVRSACERCRHLKLRCLRQPASAHVCARCERLGLICQAGAQRRVGRPSKKGDGTSEAKDGSQGVKRIGQDGNDMCSASTDLSLVQTSHAIGFDDEVTAAAVNGDLVDMQWVLPDASPSSPFQVSGLDNLILPFVNIPYTPSLQPIDCSPDTALIAPSPDVEFEKLSRMNMELHDMLETFYKLSTMQNLTNFLCARVRLAGMSGAKCMQILLKTSQEYLATIKTLHRNIGFRRSSAKQKQGLASPLETSPKLHNAASINGMDTTDNFEKAPQPQRTIDSPTAFLVISCFVQLLNPTEILYSMLQEALNSGYLMDIPIYPIEYAEVEVPDFASQAIMFTEFLRNIMIQIQILLGIPTIMSGKSGWTGLLSNDKYRCMLNRELGAVGRLWSDRPAKLISLMDETKQNIIEQSIMAC